MTTIFAVEPICRGIQHSPVNAAMLDICRLAFPDRSVRFYAETQHLNEVRRLTQGSNRRSIEWAVIDVPPVQAQFRERVTLELRLLRSLFVEARATGGHVLLLSALASTVLAVKTLHTLSRQKIPVQAVLHGYLNEVAGWRSRNPIVRMLDLKSALSVGANPGLSYVVLESSIARRLIELLPQLRGAVDWLAHPIPPEEGRCGGTLPSLPLNISFLGLATTQKGFEVFLDSAREVISRCGGAVQFHAIGRLPTDAPERDLTALATPPRQVGLPREDYIDAIERAHYICLPYQGAHYELSASGALLDAIAWCKPIIALPSPAIRDLFAAFPDIGYLCSTPRELIEIVAGLVDNCNPKTYRIQSAAMEKLRQLRLPETLARDYRTFTVQFLRRYSFEQT